MLYADKQKMDFIALELFSTFSNRQMRLTVRRELNVEVGLIDVGSLDGCEVHLLLPPLGCIGFRVFLSAWNCGNLCMQVFTYQSG